MSTRLVRAETLRKGDAVFKTDGSKVKVTNVSKGFFRNSTLIDTSDGMWSCLHNNEMVEIPDSLPPITPPVALSDAEMAEGDECEVRR